MTIVVLGIADQMLSQELREQLDQFVGVEIANLADTTHELVTSVLRHDPDVVVIHDRLGPEPMAQVLRDLAVRRPTASTLLLTTSAGPELYAMAMENSARGVLTYPFLFDDLHARFTAASDWSAQMRRLIDGHKDGPASLGEHRGTVLAVAGAKGGVGATVIATHLAWDVCREVAGLRVALVDLDLGKGDIPAYLSVNYRVSVADLAKVHEDISDRAVADSVTVHDSGLHLLLSPPDIRDTDFVTPTAVRQVVDAMRSDYDLVVLDVGSHVTPVQASVVELADEVLVVATPDVPAVRALRREIGAWESLGVRKPDQVKILVNRRSKRDEIQPETLSELVDSPLLATALPAIYRQLETSMNSRDPEVVRDQSWWNGLRSIGRELDLVKSRTPGAAVAGPTAAGSTGEHSPASTVPPAQTGATRASLRSRRRFGRGDSGQVAIETIAMVPLVFLLLFVVVQLLFTGLTVVWVQHAADTAARSASVGGNYAAAARQVVPDAVARRLTSVYDSAGGRMTVSAPLPLVAPGFFDLPTRIVSTKVVTREDR